MNIENIEKIKLTTQTIPVLKLCIIMDFHSDYYIPETEKQCFSSTTC